MPSHGSTARADSTGPNRTGVRARFYEHYVTHLRAARSDGYAGGRSPFLDQLVARDFPGQRSAVVLDLGCGAGALLRSAKAHGYTNVRGIDLSAEQVSIAHEQGVPEVEQGDVLNALESMASHSVDVVTSLDLIEHLDREEALRLADSVSRVLKPGGRWILHTVNGDSPWFGRIRYGDITHESVFTPRAIAQLLRVAGFARVACREDGPVIHGTISLGRYLLWRGVRQTLRAVLAIETGVWSRDTVLTQNFVAVGYRP